MNEKPSEMITAFLDFLETTKREYESAYAAVGAEDNKVQTFLHDMEFAKNREERNRIATKLQNSRKTRRKALWRDIYSGNESLKIVWIRKYDI